MARKRNKSIIVDILDIAMSLSWKVNIPIAILAYLGFHHLAGLELTMGTNAATAINALPMQILINFSKYLQYGIPALFIIGAVASGIRGDHRKKLLDQQTGLHSIRAMSWQEFEILVGEAYRRKGYTVRENGGGGADGGIDLFLSKNGERTVVQCKRWKTSSINVSLVRELYGIMTGEGANHCIFVTSGTYTAEAKMFAQGKPISLVDGEELFDLIATVQKNIGLPKIEALQPVRAYIHKDVFSCPVCGGSMIKRMAKKGANAGTEFMGCVNYPQCRGTVKL